jgi:hypothetical protein
VKRILLLGIETEIEWQLAYLAAQEINPDAAYEKLELTYETPGGDVTLSAQRRASYTTIEKIKNA